MSAMATETAQAEVEQPPPAAAAVPAPPSAEPKAGEKPAAGDPQAKSSKRSRSKPDESTAAATSSGPSVAAHPRAARPVARAKGWGGLGGVLIAGYLSLPTGTLAEAGLRALVAGSVCYVAAWAAAVFLWRRLVVIEIKGREQQLLATAQTARVRLDSPSAHVERPGARAAS
jgi:predicted lipid-binding transport protein (Tim44 family)